MTNIEARKRARKDIRQSLIDAGLVEGITLTDAQLAEETRTCYWHGVVRNEKAKAKENYLTYYITATDAFSRADNQTFLREVTIAIDIFSKRSFDSDANMKLLEDIEKQFIKDGYEVEFADEFFESETSFFHYPITIYKIY